MLIAGVMNVFFRLFDRTRYVVITRNRVIIARSLKDVAKHGLHLTEDEMQRIGETFLVKLSEVDLDFVRDKKKLSTVFLDRLYKKDTLGFYLQVATLIVAFLGWVM